MNLSSNIGSRVKLILFDLDGTIIDSKDVIVESFLVAAKTMGIKIDPVKIRMLIGYPLEEVVKGSLLERYDEYTIKKFISLRRKIMDELWPKKAKLFPDVIPTLKVLSKRYILGIASSSIVTRITKILQHFGIKDYFKIVSGVREGIRGKPHPDVLLYALKSANVKNSEAIYVGDAEIDCIAARNAGIAFIWVKRENVVFRECSPAYVLNSLTDLPRILGISDFE